MYMNRYYRGKLVSNTSFDLVSETEGTAMLKGGYAVHGVLPAVLPTNHRSITLIQNPEANVDEYYLWGSAFFTADGKELSPFFRRVADAGGCNEFFDTDAQANLTLIINDRKCSGLTPHTVSEALDGLNIRVSTTFDEATYLNRHDWSLDKLEELRFKNAELVKSNPNIDFHGIIKGSNPEQIRTSIHDLKGLGINRYLLPVGDYLSNNSSYDYRKALQLGAVARKEVMDLSVCGIGSKKHLDKFAFADGCVSNNHIIETRYGIFTDQNGNSYNVNSKSKKYLHRYPDVDMDAEVLRTYQRIVKDCMTAGLKYREQTVLSDWFSEEVDVEQTIETSNSARGKC